MYGIKKKRELLQITQDELAAKIGVNRSTVTKWETGQSKPRVDVLPKLAALLNCTADELLGIEHREKGETA